MTSIPILHTDRCTLSAITQSDIPVLRQILDDAETQRFLPELCKEFQTAESLQQFIVSFDKYLLQDEGILWGIRKGNTLIGFIAIMDIPEEPTLFYAMHPNFRNKGYMKGCLKKVLEFESGKYWFKNIHTQVYQENSISLQLLKFLGFQSYDMNRQKVCYRLSDTKSRAYKYNQI